MQTVLGCKTADELMLLLYCCCTAAVLLLVPQQPTTGSIGRDSDGPSLLRLVSSFVSCAFVSTTRTHCIAVINLNLTATCTVTATG